LHWSLRNLSNSTAALTPTVLLIQSEISRPPTAHQSFMPAPVVPWPFRSLVIVDACYALTYNGGTFCIGCNEQLAINGYGPQGSHLTMHRTIELIIISSMHRSGAQRHESAPSIVHDRQQVRERCPSQYQVSADLGVW